MIQYDNTFIFELETSLINKDIYIFDSCINYGNVLYTRNKNKI